jgi:hypothetical protein
MKPNTLLIASMLAICSIASAGPGEHKAMNGGQLTTVKDIDYELVASASSLQLYVRDHGKSIDLSKASAKLTLLNGTEKQEIELKPSGDKLEATGAFKVGTGAKVVVIVSNQGKQTTARFALK